MSHLVEPDPTMREAVQLVEFTRIEGGRERLEQSREARLPPSGAAILIVALSILGWVFLLLSGSALWSVLG